jgi:hypothetical protein
MKMGSFGYFMLEKFIQEKTKIAQQWTARPQKRKAKKFKLTSKNNVIK